MTIHRPEDLADLIGTCGTEGRPLVDYGIAHMGLGYPPPADHIKLILCGTVIEHHARDLTIRAAAGITMGDLQIILRDANQFLPIDADADLTLGEVILHNVYGPLRVGYGGVRDRLLGLRYIDGRGRDIHVGGRTVKNVAGYNVSGFMTGSLGQFGCVYEATLQTSAIPEAAMVTQIQVSDLVQLSDAMTDLLVSDAAPAHAMLQLCTGTPTVLHLGHLGHPDACRAQRTALDAWLSQVPGTRVDRTRLCTFQDDAQERADRRQWRRHASALVKLIVPPAQTGDACQVIFRSTPSDLHIDALPMHGCLFVGGHLDAEACTRLDEQLHRIIDGVGGLRVWYDRPIGAHLIKPFSPPQGDWPLLGQLKQSMDPLNLLNPGRLWPTEQLAQEPQRS